MPRLGAEKTAVQDPLVKYAVEAGWEYLDREEVVRQRRGETGLILHDVFVERMQRLNPGVVDASRAEDILKKLERVPPRIDGNLVAWEYLKGLRTVFVPEESRERNVRAIEAKEWEENSFHVTYELRYTGGTKPIRLDVAFFVNGIPILLVETKSARKVDGVAEALDQIRRYHREGPELLALMQVHSITHLVKYFYGPTWSISRKALFNWKEETGGRDFENLVKRFVSPQRIVRVLADFILFTRKDDVLSKVILRPHQMRAVERIVRRCEDGKKRRGLIWHTQGSGKTFTMITVAKQLSEEPVFENPTVIMLVDRNELEQQLFGNLKESGFSQFEVAQSKRHLRKLLEQDCRGLIVTMIHKFEGMPPKQCMRDNVFVLVDEAHRTTGGDLGNYLMGALPNATYVGFTGTPIDKTRYGKGTFKTFGTEDPKGYLDKYSIAESVEDGTTVPLNYALAPSNLRVDRATLEKEFLSVAEAEGVSDVDELNKILEKAVRLRTMLKKPERVKRVAAFIAKHFKEHIEPSGYKAFVVGVDREACALYKEALDELLPPEWTQVVYSPAHNDNEQLARFHLKEEEEKKIRKAFVKPEENPKILIVTEKLLTGFDAPILYCMYLDKPMRDHVLLQAIARVNRPYEDEQGRKKPAGFVLDFVGIFEHLEKALAFDSKDVEGVIHDIDLLKTSFETMMERGRNDFLSIPGKKKGDKTVEAVLEHFRDEEKRHEYYGFFRQVADLYEILSPDPFLRPFVEDYRALADMYWVLRSNYEPGVSPDRELMRKTVRLVQKHTECGEIGTPTKPAQIDERMLAKIAASEKPDTVKVFNLLKVLRSVVDLQAGRAPYLLSIGERAEQVIAQFQNRQVSTQDALKRLEDLFKEALDAQQERKRKKFKKEEFTVYWLLKRAGISDPHKAAKLVGEAFDGHPHWATSQAHARHVRRALYRTLLGAGLPEKKVSDLAQQVLRFLERAGS